MFSKWKSRYPDSWFSCNPSKNGFLPVETPLDKLPLEYNILNILLEKMKITNKNSDNLLAKNQFKETVDKILPILNLENVNKKELLAALFRDYCFIASAYSLESSHFNLNNGIYGEASEVLPKSISIPLKILSKKLNVLPWLDYAYGYGLNNAILKNQSLDKGEPNSYSTIRMFNGNNSESGFINTHVAMVSYTPELLKFQQDILENAYNIKNNDSSYENLQVALNNHYTIFLKIIESLNKMWIACKKSDYLSFRTFIMGQKGNSKIYPSEKIYFTNEDDSLKEYSFRGETGAQDSIIPSIDNLFQIKYPNNKLTEYLFELRKYRPKDHQEYIEYNRKMANDIDLINVIKKNKQCALALLRNLNVLRLFRRKHWNLTKMYIIKNTKHPVATGGTPITTWLPNQLGATLENMFDVVNSIENNKNIFNYEETNEFKSIKCELNDHYQTLIEEVAKYQDKFKNQEHKSFLSRTA